MATTSPNASPLIDTLSYLIAGPNRRAVYPEVEKLLKDPKMKRDLVSFHRLVAMKAYRLAADGDLLEAETLINGCNLNRLSGALANHHLERVMVRESFKRINRTESISLFLDGASDEDVYEWALLAKDWSKGRKYGSKLFSVSGNFALMVLLLDWRKEFSVRFLLEKVAVTSSLVLLLFARGVPLEELHPYICTLERDASFFLLMKKLFISGTDLSAYLACPVEDILSVIDDWEVYQHCLQGGLRVPGTAARSKGANFQRYLAVRDRSAEALAAFMVSYDRVEMVREELLCLEASEPETLKKLQKKVPEKIGVMIEYSLRKTAVQSLDRALFTTSSKDFSFLIGIILSEKNNDSLITALILCFLFAQRFDSFEVELILCLLYRHLFMYQEVLDTYTHLDIHTIQLERMSYLWNDLQILLEQKPGLLHLEYFDTYRTMVSQCNLEFFEAVKNGSFATAIDILGLRDALTASTTHQQMKEGVLHRSTPPSITKILPAEGRYLFDKLLAPPRTNPNQVLLTLEGLPETLDTAKIAELFSQARTKALLLVGQSAGLGTGLGTDPGTDLDNLLSSLIAAQEAAFQQLCH
ncbi:hypothetical protein NEDG_01381 [Nematocida displodere]|uniref:Uncharacterized protein n=1 Tax=Nematocida displodere TaxID=1805483 RepID=A0A177EBV7_9MICR|nr:hypothetical protein NEDG_01381 [Nematocida displodere]